MTCYIYHSNRIASVIELTSSRSGRFFMNVETYIDKFIPCFAPIAARNIDREELIKRFFVAVAIIAMVPVISAFAIKDILDGRTTEGLIVFSLIVLPLSLTVILTRSIVYQGSIRIMILLTTIAHILEFISGGGNGGAFLWFFVMPTSTVYLMGVREGSIWVGGMITMISVLIFGRIGYHYPFDLSIRFLAVFTLMGVLSCSFELLREWYLRKLIKEKEKVQSVLGEIRVLKGLIPICASCRKIRDDKGFWTQIDEYMRNHSEVEFSHGICPDCAMKLYPSSTVARHYTESAGCDTGQNP